MSVDRRVIGRRILNRVGQFRHQPGLRLTSRRRRTERLVRFNHHTAPAVSQRTESYLSPKSFTACRHPRLSSLARQVLFESPNLILSINAKLHADSALPLKV